MNEQEVIEDLRSQCKPYLYAKMAQSYFSNTIIRQEAGLLKPKTWERFLGNLGYVKVEGLWVKK